MQRLIYIILFISFFIINQSGQTSEIALWHADGNAQDSTGTNHGSLKNGASFTSGKFGDGFQLDGIDDYVSITSQDLPLSTESRSISIWFKTSQTNKEMYMLAYGSVVSAGAFAFGILSGNLMITQCGQNLNAGFVADNQFHHGVVTFSANSYRLYVDGSLVGTKTMSTNTQSNPAAFIGRAATGAYFQGVLDEITVFDYTLSAGEVGTLYNTIPIQIPESSSISMFSLTILFAFFLRKLW